MTSNRYTLKSTFLAMAKKGGIFIPLAFLLVQMAALRANEPDLPVVASVDAGYFPTLAEDVLLRGASDSRSLGTYSHEGPDLRAQVATDIFPYENGTNFYRRYDSFFRPLDHTLGVLTRHDAITLEGLELSGHAAETSLVIDADAGLFTRRFDPDLAHVKAGPLYFDLLWVGAGVIYSDYNGRQPLPDKVDGDNTKDGWTGYVDVAVRGLFRITDTIYISAIANLMYLPFENELAFRMGNSAIPGVYTRLNVGDTVGDWDLLFYDEFIGRPGVDLSVDADADAIDRAGRYYFGFYEDRTNEFYNDRQAFFVNRAGFRATRPVFDREWRMGARIERSDYWRTFTFEEHGKRDYLELWLQYEGSRIPFAPRVSYEYWSNDGFDSMWHRGMLNLTGRITENVIWDGELGLGANTGTVSESVRWLWEVGLRHVINRSTLHGIRVGENFMNNEILNETITARYLRYYVNQRVNKSMHLDAFMQLSDNEVTDRPGIREHTRDRVAVGLALNYRPLDFTDLRASMFYEKVDQLATTDDQHRWVWRFEWIQRLAHRLTGNVFYQYEEMDSLRRPFTEHLFGMSLRRYF
jgi:hypothetical protein